MKMCAKKQYSSTSFMTMRAPGNTRVVVVIVVVVAVVVFDDAVVVVVVCQTRFFSFLLKITGALDKT